jgi:hypothetical protein
MFIAAWNIRFSRTRVQRFFPRRPTLPVPWARRRLASIRYAAAFANFEGAFSGNDQLYGGKGGVKFFW